MGSESGTQRLLWYFAYGANMSEAVLTKRRKIQPYRSKVARCEEYSLAFNVMGVPYSDPATGGLQQREVAYIHGSDEKKDHPPTLPMRSWGTHSLSENEDARLSETAVHGVAYLLNEKDLWRIMAIEGFVL